MDDATDWWRTPDSSWLDVEEANEKEAMVICSECRKDEAAQVPHG
jgi:hypothetical protein